MHLMARQQQQQLQQQRRQCRDGSCCNPAAALHMVGAVAPPEPANRHAPVPTKCVLAHPPCAHPAARIRSLWSRQAIPPQLDCQQLVPCRGLPLPASGAPVALCRAGWGTSVCCSQVAIGADSAMSGTGLPAGPAAHCAVEQRSHPGSTLRCPSRRAAPAKAEHSSLCHQSHRAACASPRCRRCTAATPVPLTTTTATSFPLSRSSAARL